MVKAVALLATLPALCTAFVPPTVAPRASKMTMMAEKSKSVPFLDATAALSGKDLPAGVGFDPLGLSDIKFDFSYLMVPVEWDGARAGLSSLNWFRESEIKHGRFAMLGCLGWVAVDLGLRLPGAKYAAVGSAADAHNAMVSSGDMTVGLIGIGLFELIMGAAIYEMSKGSDRQPGEFTFDPLRLSKDPAKAARFAASEIKNGRLAMLAFGGIATQAALTGHGFPYLN